MRTPLYATTLLVTLLTLAIAPAASAGHCVPSDATLNTPTGQHASHYAYSCDSGNFHHESGNLYVHDDATGQTVYANGYHSEGTYSYGNSTNSTESYESYSYSVGAYNTNGNLVPSVGASRGEGTYTYNGWTSSWEHGDAYVSWGPYSQRVDLVPLLP